MAVRWILLVVFISAANLCLGQSSTPNLQGLVFDAQHHGVEGATVSAGTSARHSVQTDRNGHFSLEISPTVQRGDSITLHVEKPGFRPWVEDLALSDLPVTVDLESISSTKPPSPSQKLLWKLTGDGTIDSVQARLNALGPQESPDAQKIGILSGLFEAPVFSYLGEELPEDALYRFCRSERILSYYGPAFNEPTVRAAVSTAAQNLIYLQDIFGALYGPAFSAKENCDKYGDQPREEYKAHLGSRILDRESLDKQKAKQVVTSMLSTLASIGMASPPKIAPSASSASDPYVEADKDYRLGDFEKAFALFTQAATEGNAKAAFMVGYLREKGQGSPPDLQKELIAYQQADEGGDPRATDRLAEWYEGSGRTASVERDCGKSRFYFERAIAANYLPSMLTFARLSDDTDGLCGFENHSQLATQLYERAAKLGSLEAMKIMGDREPNFAQKKYWYDQLISKGDVASMYELGMLYYDGIETTANFEKAKELFVQSSEKGYQPAKKILAYLPATLFAEEKAVLVEESMGHKLLGQKLLNMSGGCFGNYNSELYIQVTSAGIRVFEKHLSACKERLDTLLCLNENELKTLLCGDSLSVGAWGARAIVDAVKYSAGEKTDQVLLTSKGKAIIYIYLAHTSTGLEKFEKAFQSAYPMVKSK
jgi:TPR repeat protein